MNNLEQHKRSDAIKWVAVFLAVILLAVAVSAALTQGFTNANPYGWLDKETEDAKDTETESGTNTEAKVYDIVDVIEQELSLSFGPLMSNGEATAASDDPCTSQTITATLSPSTVSDSYIYWSLAWASNAPLKDKDINEYIRLTDGADAGSTTITINCYKSFRGSNIVLTAKSRQGEKTATATIQYNGIPSSLTINAVSNAGSYNLGKDTVALLYSGNTYTTTISQDNIFHDVGSDYNNFDVSVTGVGSFKVADYVRNPRGTGFNVDYSNIPTKSLASCDLSKLIACSVSGNTLTIQAKQSYKAYYDEFVVNSTYGEPYGTYKNKFYGTSLDADGNEAYLLVTVKNKTYNFSNTYKVYIGDAVSSVSLSSSTVTF